MAKLIKTDGTIEEIHPENGTNFQLEEMYGHIGCNMIEICDSHREGQILVFDENGLFEQEELNLKATTLMHPRLRPFHCSVIKGNAILCDNSEVK